MWAETKLWRALETFEAIQTLLKDKENHKKEYVTARFHFQILLGDTVKKDLKKLYSYISDDTAALSTMWQWRKRERILL